MKISPKYMVQLISRIELAIWKEFSSYKNVEAYIKRWHEDDGNFWENFRIANKDDGNIDLPATLLGIGDDELLFKIAVDLGIEIPGLVYSVPEIKGILSSSYETAASTFENALKKVIDEPATSVCCANSALESIVKHICQNSAIQRCDPHATLYDLVQHILMQRRCELWGEGQRFFDIKRLNIDMDRRGKGHTETLWNAASNYPAGDKNLTFLIPKQEIDANPNMVQNPL